MAESLFALELLVHWVRLEPVLGQGEEPTQPAVAFRLLDFPTLLIRPPWEPRRPDQARLHFPFGRGKSCLFRGVPEALLGQLCRSPLYAMLLDVPSAPCLPRLLGSCPLSLAQAARELLGELTVTPLPIVRAHQGLHPLQDLLGRPVGEMSLGYRLLSLGGGLERHFSHYASHKDNLGPLPAGDNLGPLPAGDNLGPLPAGDNLGPLPAGDNLGPLPAGDNLGPLPAGDNPGPLPAGDNPGPLPAGDNPGPLPAGDNPGPRPAGGNLGPRPAGGNLGPRPAGGNLGPRPAGGNLGPRPAGGNLGPLPAGDNLGPLPAGDNLGPLPAGDNPGSLRAKAAETCDTAPRKRVAMVGQVVKTSSAAVSIHYMEGLEPQHPAEPLEDPKTEHTSVGLPDTQHEGGMLWSPRVPEKGGVTMLDREELEIEANMFCPPPMYYRHPSSAPIEITTAPIRILDVPMASVFQDTHYLEEEEECGPGKDLNPLKSDTKPNIALPRAPTSAATLGQLPLLNALLLELSLLNHGSIRPPDHNSTVHPQLAWLYRPTNDDTKAPTTDQDKSGQKSPSPSLPKRNKSTLTAVSVTTPSPMVKTRILKGPAKVLDKNAVGSTVGLPKKKLMYGLTNTFRLRLQHTNPDMLLLHERRERHRKQQAESTKEKGGRPRSRGILAKNPRSPAQRRRSHALRAKRGTHSSSVDENIETLIQNSRADEQDSSNTKDEEKAVHLKHSLEHVLRHHDGNTEGFNHTMTNQKPVGMFKSNPLQRSSLLDSINDIDLEHRVIAHSTYLDSRSISTGHSQLSSRTSGNGSPEHRNGEDLIDSLEYTGYSDDFNSPHYTARSSEALGGSPEPEKSRHTDSDSESQSLSKSAFSSKSGSISAPIPLISNASPVQSFKRTHDLIKPHSLVNALNVSNSDPGVLPQKSLFYQHAKIPVSNVSEVIPDRLTTNGAEIRNTGSSQKLYDTSQSVRTSQMSSYMPSTVSDPQLSVFRSDVSDLSRTEDRLSELGSPEFYKQYKPMTELVVNQLPGYTM